MVTRHLPIDVIEMMAFYKFVLTLTGKGTCHHERCGSTGNQIFSVAGYSFCKCIFRGVFHKSALAYIEFRSGPKVGIFQFCKAYKI